MAGKYLKKKAPRKGGTLRVWLLLALVLLTSGGIGTTVAKYIQSTGGKILMKAPEFYFTSNYLTAEGDASYMLNSGTTEVEFTLSNMADELRFSDVEIGYNITLAKSVADAAGELSSYGGTFAGDSGKTAAVVLKNLVPGVTYTVTATGNAGYSQTLSGSFTVADKDQNVYKNVMTSPDGYLLLTVWTHNVAGTMNVSFPAGLVPDNTNADMGSVFNIDGSTDSSFASTFEKYSSQTYRFFGSASAGSFDVTGTINGITYTAAESALP